MHSIEKDRRLQRCQAAMYQTADEAGKQYPHLVHATDSRSWRRRGLDEIDVDLGK